jgi:2-polyprenyl-6-methoxyphenol hydroxylase-like FAD-dependent oxidoreductase
LQYQTISHISCKVFFITHFLSSSLFTVPVDPKAVLMLKKISVIGGGLGGLAFAQGARVLGGYQVTVFERDKTPTHRSQGYQIGLNEDGLACLSKLNLPGFKELTQENPLSGFMMTDHNLEALVRFPVQDITKQKDQRSKMSLVNRFKLRDILSSGLDIRWDKRLLAFEEKEDCVIAHFEDGTFEAAALLVGADGVQSKVLACTFTNTIPTR